MLKNAKDPTLLDYLDISNIRLSLNSGPDWPNERMNLKFAKNDFRRAYNNYASFYEIYADVKKNTAFELCCFQNTLYLCD